MRYANLYVLGKPSSLSTEIVQYTPREWLHCERHAELVSIWACDSYMSSRGLYRLWCDAIDTGDSWANELRRRVESTIVALRLARDERRRQWVLGMIGMFGSLASHRACQVGGLPRWHVESIVRRAIGAYAWEISSTVCQCGKIRRRVVQSARDAEKHEALVQEILKSLRVDFIDGLRLHGASTVVSYYICSACGSEHRHELEVVVDNQDNGWTMTTVFDLTAISQKQ